MRLVGQQSRACESARERISLHLDGELFEFEELALNEHLARCAGCQAHAASLAEVSDRLRSAPLEQPEFAVVLPHRPRIRVPLRTAQAAAAAVALAFIGFSAEGLTGAQQSISLTEATSGRASNPAPKRETHATVRFRIGQGAAPRPVRGRASII
jgi:predicted anti-sigma-YlaC factor YlaD